VLLRSRDSAIHCKDVDKTTMKFRKRMKTLEINS
jgi:hypothetical protein